MSAVSILVASGPCRPAETVVEPGQDFARRLRQRGDGRNDDERVPEVAASENRSASVRDGFSWKLRALWIEASPSRPISAAGSIQP
jgi:hypothetical protein